MEAGKWSSGRPVFKKVDGEERFLLVQEGQTFWSIRKSLNASGALIKSGKATNSPTSTEAVWSYRNGSGSGNDWIEGDVSLTCKSDDDKEDDSNVGDNSFFCIFHT